MRIWIVVLGAFLLAASLPLGLDAQQSDAPGEAAKKAPAKKPVAKVVKPRPKPAKELFGAARSPSPLAARAIGSYAKGCLAGGTALAIDGSAWQAMRLSRNRNWGHPELVALVEKLAVEAKLHDGWPGLLVGDLSQPRGGPMLTGHVSHQVGLDADIWLTPMPNRRLTEREREDMSAVSMLAADRISVDPEIWKPEHVRLIKRAATYKSVERIFVHPAIKKALCEAAAKDTDRQWLSKVRPMWGHHYHFHIRIDCPGGSANCERQPDPAADDGCGAELKHWLALVKAPPKLGPSGPGKPGLTLDQLPSDCRAVLASGTDAAKSAATTDKAIPLDKKTPGKTQDKAKTPVPKKAAEKK